MGVKRLAICSSDTNSSVTHHSVFSTVNKFSIMDAAFDLGGGFDPAKGFGVFDSSWPRSG